MKIGIDARFFGPEDTGLGRYTAGLVNELAKIDRKNRYSLFISKDTRERFSHLPRNFSFKEVTARHYTLREQIALPKIIRGSDIDFMHFPHFTVPILSSFIPFVVTIHDLIKHKYTGGEATTLPLPLYLLKHQFYKFDFKWAVTRSKKIITPTQNVKKDLVDIIGAEPQKISVINLGVYKTAVRNSGDGGKNLPQKLLRHKYIIFVGNAYPYKNVETLIDLLNFLPRDISLVLVGARDVFWEKIEKSVREKKLTDRVKILGYIEDADLKTLYKNALAFVSASLEEGFGLPPLEAMQNSCPVVLSDIPVFREVCGEAAIFIDPQYSEGYSREITKLMNPQYRDERVKLGFSHVQRYSWKKTAAKTLTVYKEVYEDILMNRREYSR